MRNMVIAHIFEATLRLEEEKKAGLGLRRRILQAFSVAPLPALCRDFCTFEKKSFFCIFLLDFLEVQIPITYNLRYLTYGGS